jgi:glycosyltransferase involved in cell wall biosynthesis
VSARPGQNAAHSIAYVLKGFPRLSETFIASELYRLEQAGVPLRLYVLKPVEEHERNAPHTIAERIRARPVYLPGTSSLSGVSRFSWLAANLPAFLPALRRTARRRPLGLARAAWAAVLDGLRARNVWWAAPRKVFMRDLMLGVALADRLLEAPDVRHLHAHFAHGTTTVTWYASIITGLPFSFTAHARDIYVKDLNPGGLLQRKLRAARFVVTCTETNRRHLERMADGVPVHRIYHGLNVEFTRLLAAEGTGPPGPNGGFRVLAVGRLVAKKGFDVLVEACALAAAEGVPVEAVIVGHPAPLEPEVGPQLEAQIATLGLTDRVRLVGSIAQSQLYEEYLRSSVFCLPCRIAETGDRDGIPNVMVEAMACGVPVVGTNVSAIPELVVSGSNGLLVPPEDPCALAEALLQLHRDPELGRRLGADAVATVRARFDGDRLADELVTLFREAAA